MTEAPIPYDCHQRLPVGPYDLRSTVSTGCSECVKKPCMASTAPAVGRNTWLLSMCQAISNSLPDSFIPSSHNLKNIMNRTDGGKWSWVAHFLRNTRTGKMKWPGFKMGALASRCYPPNNRAAIGHLLRHLACHGRVGEVLKVPFTANFNKSHQHKLEVQ